MESATQVQILNEAIYISHSANIFKKSLNQTILRQLWRGGGGPHGIMAKLPECSLKLVW